MNAESLVDSVAEAFAIGPATSVAGPIADARAEVAKYQETEPIYAELMETYVALGELLETNGHITSATAPTLPAAEVQEHEDECRALMTRLIELERPMEFEWQQQWARWCVQNMIMEGVAA